MHTYMYSTSAQVDNHSKTRCTCYILYNYKHTYSTITVKLATLVHVKLYNYMHIYSATTCTAKLTLLVANCMLNCIIYNICTCTQLHVHVKLYII